MIKPIPLKDYKFAMLPTTCECQSLCIVGLLLSLQLKNMYTVLMYKAKTHKC